MDEEKHMRAFRGCWCPPELFDLLADGTINATEAMLILVIDSFVQHTGADCYASTEYLGKRLGGIRADETSRMVGRLRKIGLLIQTKFDGRKRHMHVFWSRPMPWAGSQGRVGENPKAGLGFSPSRKDIKLKDGEETSRASARPPIPNPPNAESSKPPSSAKFQKIFTRLWGQHYGQTYRFQGGQDGKAIQSLFRHLGGDKTKFKEVVRRYLANDADYYRGHTAAKLNKEINAFMTPTEDEVEQGPDIRVTTVEDDGSPINFD